jgi:hypothetical protein
MSVGSHARHQAYYDLLEACTQEGCPICRLVLSGVAKYMNAIMYEYVNDPPTRIAVVAAGGYCNDHSWQLREMNAGLGTALIYRHVLQEARRVMSELSSTNRTGIFRDRRSQGSVINRLVAMVGPDQQLRTDIPDPHLSCPACQIREHGELLYLGVLLDHFHEEDTFSALRHAGGLCLVHLDQAIRYPGHQVAVKRLIALQGELLKQLDEELAEFLRKQDYRFCHERYGSEKDSWIRAIAMVAGKPGIR